MSGFAEPQPNRFFDSLDCPTTRRGRTDNGSHFEQLLNNYQKQEYAWDGSCGIRRDVYGTRL